MLAIMTRGIIAKLGRGLGWASVTIISVVLGAALAFLPLSQLPGPFHMDFVNGQGMGLLAALFMTLVVSWRVAPTDRNIRFSWRVGRRFIWLAASAFPMAFWPLGLAVWINGYHSTGRTTHDMVIVGVDRATFGSAVTPIETFTLREPSTGWTADLKVTDDRKRFASVGRCVRIFVHAGHLGLDWIGDAKPITCPSDGFAD